MLIEGGQVLEVSGVCIGDEWCAWFAEENSGSVVFGRTSRLFLVAISVMRLHLAPSDTIGVIGPSSFQTLATV